MNIEALIDPFEQSALLRRLELFPRLLRRKQEELIASLVPIEESLLEQKQSQLLGDVSLDQYLRQRCLTENDFQINLRLKESLLRFAVSNFGVGIDERFLQAEGSYDEVIYSLIRVFDYGLARELWISLAEGEITFAEAAQQYSQGPESFKKGIMGPVQIGLLQPKELALWLTGLCPGEINPPRAIGEWHVLVRLEKLIPARLDHAMRERLLLEELDRFLDERVQRQMAGLPLDDLHYNP
jgi:hypothetical protein